MNTLPTTVTNEQELLEFTKSFNALFNIDDLDILIMKRYNTYTFVCLSMYLKHSFKQDVTITYKPLKNTLKEYAIKYQADFFHAYGVLATDVVAELQTLVRSNKIDFLFTDDTVEAVESTETTTNDTVVAQAAIVSVEAANDIVEVNDNFPKSFNKDDMLNTVKKEAAFILNALHYDRIIWLGLKNEEDEKLAYINDLVNESVFISDDLYNILSTAVHTDYRESDTEEEYEYDAADIKYILFNIRKYISLQRNSKVDSLFAAA